MSNLKNITVNEIISDDSINLLNTITLFPVLRQDKQLTMQQDLRKFFGDTFEAQEKYFKSNKMIFCFDEQSWPDMALVKAILQEELINRPLEGVESISFHPF